MLKIWIILNCSLLIHPALNVVITKMTKEKLLGTNIVLGVLYSGINVLKLGSFCYSHIVGFVCIYFFVAYMKKYLTNFSQSLKNNRIILLSSIVGCFGIILITNLLGLHSAYFSHKLVQWSTYMNPFIILMVLAMFNLFKSKQYINKGINYISSISMLVYIIHCNSLVHKHLKGNMFNYIYKTYSYEYIALWSILLALIMFVASVILSIIYKESLQKIVKTFCNWWYDYIAKKIKWLINILMKLD